MCRDKRADDSVPLDNISFLDEDDNVYFLKFFPTLFFIYLFIQIVEETDSTTIQKVPRSVIIEYINSLAIGETNAAFITPIIAFKIVDFIYLNSYRTVISPEVSSK